MTMTSQEQMAEARPRDLHEYLTTFIKQAVITFLAQEKIDFDVEQLPIDLRFSAQASFGDYSMPIMAWTGKNKLNRPGKPLPIAEALATILRQMEIPAIAEISVTKPGFLNFRLNQPFIGQVIIERVLDAGADFGQNEVGVGTRVIIEHTSINSNKAAHVGHLRNSCIGDTVVRMLRSQGYSVEAENYIDDSGVQVADVVVGFTLLRKGMLQLPGGNAQLPDESFDYYCSRVYVAVGKLYDGYKQYDDTQSELRIAAKQRSEEALALRKAVLHAIEHGEEPEAGPDYPAEAADLSQQIVLAHLKTMSRLNISFDLLTWESAILGAGLWKHTFEMLRAKGLLEKPETGPAAGCWLLPFGDSDAQQGDEKERMQDKILVRSDGTATYTAKDIANQLWKFGLVDDPRLGIQFHYVPWGVQHDGRLLWTMRTPRDAASSGEAEDTSRFGHAKRVINVIDVRQSYTQQVVVESLRRLGYIEQANNSKHIAYEVVTLSKATAANLGVDISNDRNFYAMSGRKGIEIKADDLISAATERMLAVRKQDAKLDLPEKTASILAASAIRYFMIRFNLQQVIALDIDEALRANGDTGVYLQYAYARANSILRKLEAAGYAIPANLATLPEHLEQSEWELLRHIDAYPRRLAEASEDLVPSTLATYVYDLATHFSDFYEHTPPILRETNEPIKAFRASLVQATVQTMGNALRVLGLVPLESI
ncbi:MAG: arginine--tRNA ligase [Ktedonobacteraceae bacterium]